MSKPFLVLTGDPGTGKSLEAYRTFQNSLALVNARNNSFFYEKRLKRGRLGTNYRLPKRYKLIDANGVGATVEPYSSIDNLIIKAEADDHGSMKRVRIKEELESTFAAVASKSILAKSNNQPPPYDNLIVDEWGTFLSQVFEEILPTCTTSKGTIDTRDAYRITNSWTHDITVLMRQLLFADVGVCVVFHKQEADGNKKGGPKAPSRNIAGQICADADGVLERVLRNPELGAVNENGTPLTAKYIWIATPSEDSFRKLRGLEPEDLQRVSEMDLYDIITDLAGFSM